MKNYWLQRKPRTYSLGVKAYYNKAAWFVDDDETMIPCTGRLIHQVQFTNGTLHIVESTDGKLWAVLPCDLMT